MHLLGGIVIGLTVGRLFSLFTLRKLKGGKVTFMGIGVIGAMLGDLCFRMLHRYDLVSGFFYQEVTIIFEMILGAGIACYLVNFLGKKDTLSL
jgi:uncharacterized membrane protein YeaQ/YmgE (transglycosylase-associated protein family)